jgi:hypothetical protein
MLVEGTTKKQEVFLAANAGVRTLMVRSATDVGFTRHRHV